MKKISIIMVGMLLTFNLFPQQQVIAKYKALEAFKGDKKSYLKQNFEKRQALYVGKTIGELLNDIEITPIGFDWIVESKTLHCVEIYLYFERKPGMPDKQKFLDILLEEPLPLGKAIMDMVKVYPCNKWVDAHYQFFKDIKIKKIMYNPYEESLDSLKME